MAERFNCYVHTPATRATGREIRPDGEFVLATDYAKLEAEVARLTTILYGKPMAAPEIPEVADGPLMSAPQFFGMLNELRNSAQLHEATASAELAKENDG